MTRCEPASTQNVTDAMSPGRQRLVAMMMLRRAREQRRQTTGDIAPLIGVSRQAVDSWEAGLCSPTFDNLLRWAYVLGCEVRIASVTPVSLDGRRT
ncbi:helix-turn-helix transcriptional regulator [Oceanibaculum indicum]|uniref:Helix-turn-helix protein n=1 Tax=Oceanibaculum indicum TaxID=526216 RepID=A0A420WGQ2_9PROT|nr:helix-turn-helix transcriptional regulator [Oceanibaculum indicum]RKQ70146.1 helix-turn-helix protein [Oceanibaculum indicum]